MSRIERLVENYYRFISLPWQKDLAGAQRAIFVVYDKNDERRLRAHKELFEQATKETQHGWKECDLTDAFALWMSSIDYRESYFESPDDLALKLEDEFLDHLADKIIKVIQLPDVDDQTVVAIYGIASLFGFARVSELMSRIDKKIQGRVVVFFPGVFDNNNYRLLDARDGWNYLAVPITAHDAMFVS
ncbi:MAG TPA: DUF1788 domain-containing protein [Syntrophaceae bacterium]|jgi:hypothetical protein|nr:DUF1788 domain-containing protein [Syntrophaceae bacterium]